MIYECWIFQCINAYFFHSCCLSCWCIGMLVVSTGDFARSSWRKKMDGNREITGGPHSKCTCVQPLHLNGSFENSFCPLLLCSSVLTWSLEKSYFQVGTKLWLWVHLIADIPLAFCTRVLMGAAVIYKYQSCLIIVLEFFKAQEIESLKYDVIYKYCIQESEKN